MENKKIGIFDADFIPFYVCHNKDEKEKTLEECIELTDKLIDGVCLASGIDLYTGFLTVGKCFRYEVNPGYKSNRKYAELPKFINEIKEYLIKNHNFKLNKNYEADDLIISYKKTLKNAEVFIISPDKDLLNLEGTHYNPRLNKFHYTSKEEAHRYFWLSMLIGDSADGIKGVKGIGPVGAKKILDTPNIMIEYRDIVLEKYCEIYGEYMGIKEFMKNYLSLKLVDTVEVNVELNNIRTLSGKET